LQISETDVLQTNKFADCVLITVT